MSTATVTGYTAKVYSDVYIDDGYDFIHTWIELTDDKGNKDVYSYNAKNGLLATAKSLYEPVEEAFSTTDESAGRKQASISTLINLTSDEYTAMKRKGNALKESADKGTLDYALLQATPKGEAPNCVEITDTILRAGKKNILNNCLAPGQALGIIKNLNEYGIWPG